MYPIDVSNPSYYRSKIYKNQLDLPSSAFKNRQMQQFYSQIPHGKEYFQPSNKKHFSNRFHDSEIEKDNVLAEQLTEEEVNRSRVVMDRSYFRSLNVDDIQGAKPNTLISKAVKNREKALSMARKEEGAGIGGKGSYGNGSYREPMKNNSMIVQKQSQAINKFSKNKSILQNNSVRVLGSYQQYNQYNQGANQQNGRDNLANNSTIKASQTVNYSNSNKSNPSSGNSNNPTPIAKNFHFKNNPNSNGTTSQQQHNPTPSAPLDNPTLNQRLSLTDQLRNIQIQSQINTQNLQTFQSRPTHQEHALQRQLIEKELRIRELEKRLNNVQGYQQRQQQGFSNRQRQGVLSREEQQRKRTRGDGEGQYERGYRIGGGGGGNGFGQRYENRNISHSQRLMQEGQGDDSYNNFNQANQVNNMMASQSHSLNQVHVPDLYANNSHRNHPTLQNQNYQQSPQYIPNIQTNEIDRSNIRRYNPTFLSYESDRINSNKNVNYQNNRTSDYKGSAYY